MVVVVSAEALRVFFKTYYGFISDSLKVVSGGLLHQINVLIRLAVSVGFHPAVSELL